MRGRFYRRWIVRPSDENIADALINLFREQLSERGNDGNFKAAFLALAKAKPRVQKCVLNAFKSPKARRRPQDPIGDEDWLMWFAAWKDEYETTQETTGTRITDLDIIKYALTHGIRFDALTHGTRFDALTDGTRFGRRAGQGFDPNIDEGRAEIRRVRDRVIRARRAKKSKK